MKTYISKIATLSLLIIMALIAQTSLVNAQQEKYPSGQKGKHSGSNREKIEAQRVAFITQELDLTPDEAKVFWPVYNEYDSKRHELKKSFKHTGDLHKPEIEKLTEKEAVQILDNQIIEAQKLLDLRKEYHAKFKSVLPAVKVLQLYDAEREFQKMLIDRLRHNKPNPKSPAEQK
jgi:hypothetical protein